MGGVVEDRKIYTYDWNSRQFKFIVEFLFSHSIMKMYLLYDGKTIKMKILSYKNISAWRNSHAARSDFFVLIRNVSGKREKLFLAKSFAKVGRYTKAKRFVLVKVHSGSGRKKVFHSIKHIPLVFRFGEVFRRS